MSAKKKPTDVKESSTPKQLSFFDFLNSINEGARGVNLLEYCTADSSEATIPNSPDKAYVSFMINRGLSYFADTVLYANAMNERAALPAKMQYDFLRYGIRPRKRFSKWTKKIDDSADIQLIMNEYGYSAEKARDAYKLYSEEALIELRMRNDTGGTGKKSK